MIKTLFCHLYSIVIGSKIIAGIQSKVKSMTTNFIVAANVLLPICCHIGSGICLFDLILYVTLTIFQLNRGGSIWAEPVLS